MEKSEQKVVIIGCGWLGQIVGESLVHNGASVFGSYRRVEVAEKLNRLDISGFELDFNENPTIPEDILQDATHVLAFVSPSASKRVPYETLLVELLKQFSSKVKVIFTSSTSIYPKDAGTYDESFELNLDKNNRLLLAETALQKLLGDRLTKLRLAGLIGPKRHPAYYLSGKKLLNNGMNSINLIHAYDIVSAIDWLLDNDHFGHTYNLVNSHHPTKKAYYTKAAIHLGIEPPEFGSEPAENRVILGNAIEEETSFRYSRTLDNFRDFIR